MPGSSFILRMIAGLAVFFATAPADAWQTAPQAGLRDNTPTVFAFVDARIVQGPGRIIEKGTVVIRNGIIEAVGASVRPPADAALLDYTGLTVYAGLIESYTHTGVETPPADSVGAQYWNDAVQPQRSAAALYRADTKALEKLRANGFALAFVVPRDGIFTGMGTIVHLGDGQPNDNILRADIATHIRVEHRRDQRYPASLMGALALIRQTLQDARWYAQAHEAFAINPRQPEPEENKALTALLPAVQSRQPLMMRTGDELTLLRAAAIAKEMGSHVWFRGSGHEYRMLDAIKAIGAPIVVPVTFPSADRFDVDTPADAMRVSTAELRHWEAAPENPGRLHRAGVVFTLTADGLEKSESFHEAVREAIQRGLPYDAALAALTTAPAKLFGIETQTGTVDIGKRAHLTVTDGPLFAENVRVREVWIEGRRYETAPKTPIDVRGTWAFSLVLPGMAAASDSLVIKDDISKRNGTVHHAGETVKLQTVSLVVKQIALSFNGDKWGHKGLIRLTGSIEEKRMAGQGELPDGAMFSWSAALLAPIEKKRPTAPEPGASTALPAIYPPVSFGRPALPPRPRHVLVRGATLWTLDARGRLENADMLTTDGKITAIGQNLQAPEDAVIVDGRGKHVTPGLIDAHSHTAISEGINEGTQAVTAEVGIGDVIDSYDIDVYRELAGGLTVANVLHGSANPIGGKNQIIKLRWGHTPEGMKFEDAKPGIKFALGENVKQSNWANPTSRYPQTRMGVEQIIRDRFRAAQDYDRTWKTYNTLKDKRGVVPPRRDAELETMLEILRGDRIVHSHSYRQDEILMLIRVADDFGFKIATFQHVLEGYKVADAIARHGAGASTFSDWWAYKIEAYDAIPHNGALMHQAGVSVTFNSDSDELARRLNTEAAKAVKYGGVSETEALKFVTINAAQQLKIDGRVGTLEVGKDADFAVWNGSPLSTYTVCEETWIEGRRFFDHAEDLELRRQVARDRALLIQKLLAKKHGLDTQKPGT
ncbi:MAG: amidohydrolase family protein [candidate division Zixibacteria bacterium]|nr:amidohydrolase family protein [candidate division Zixibacteria bacterium]